MSDVTLTLGLEQPDHETKLSKAIDAFARWREQTVSGAAGDPDALPIMVRTEWDISGQMQKKLTFADDAGKDTFLRFWRGEQDGFN